MGLQVSGSAPSGRPRWRIKSLQSGPWSPRRTSLTGSESAGPPGRYFLAQRHGSREERRPPQSAGGADRPRIPRRALVVDGGDSGDAREVGAPRKGRLSTATSPAPRAPAVPGPLSHPWALAPRWSRQWSPRPGRCVGSKRRRSSLSAPLMLGERGPPEGRPHLSARAVKELRQIPGKPRPMGLPEGVCGFMLRACQLNDPGARPRSVFLRTLTQERMASGTDCGWKSPGRTCCQQHQPVWMS